MSVSVNHPPLQTKLTQVFPLRNDIFPQSAVTFMKEMTGSATVATCHANVTTFDLNLKIYCYQDIFPVKKMCNGGTLEEDFLKWKPICNLAYPQYVTLTKTCNCEIVTILLWQCLMISLFSVHVR